MVELNRQLHLVGGGTSPVATTGLAPLPGALPVPHPLFPPIRPA